MLVFRDGRQAVNGPRLLKELTTSLQQVSSVSTPTRGSLIDALLRAGELECALADARDPASAPLAELTDALAAGLVAGDGLQCHRLERTVCALAIPETLTVSRPEGFAYYALHPLDSAELAGSLAVRLGRIAVIGIRTIGTTLSAVVAAEARKKGTTAERITVRPTGHPWDRKLDFSPAERAWINRQGERQADFWVVDEGPGLSGSSFLAVAEALVNAGVPHERITLLGSASPDVARLCAPDAAARWRRFRSYFTRPPLGAPAEAVVSVGAGAWRQVFLDGEDWPAVWPQFERAKFLRADGKALFKFEGLGRVGTEVRQRSRSIADAGFGPGVGDEEDGYARFEVISGRAMTTARVSTGVIERIAAYCAWRAAAFAAEPRPTSELEHMIRTNAREGLSEDMDVPELQIERPVIADGKMHPHEWRLTRAGQLLKLDGASHGDDHFFPGPTDIAWDLAGAIVEWRLEPAATEFFLESYRGTSGDDARARLPGFLLAYALFRLGYCTMARESLRRTDEEMRFQREANEYRVLSSQYRALTAKTGYSLMGTRY